MSTPRGVLGRCRSSPSRPQAPKLTKKVDGSGKLWLGLPLPPGGTRDPFVVTLGVAESIQRAAACPGVLLLICLCRSCVRAPQLSGPLGPPVAAAGSVIHLGRCPGTSHRARI